MKKKCNHVYGTQIHGIFHYLKYNISEIPLVRDALDWQVLEIEERQACFHTRNENIIFMQPFLVEFVNALAEEAFELGRTERLASEDLVRLENNIKTFSARYAYTHRASSRDPLTEKVRKSMIANVKSSAYENLVRRDKGKFGGNEEEFTDYDAQVFNFARDEISKNESTKKPAILLQRICACIKSIGQIKCGRIVGTCWLVKDRLIITNYHVYMMFNTERIELGDPNLPIKVSFDYFYFNKPEHIRTVEVDEQGDPQIENSHLDYKFLRLKEGEAISHRARLGQFVRNRRLQEGLVIIVGHPAGREMLEETCVVVSNHSWRERIRQRHEKFRQMNQEGQQRHDADFQPPAAVHMANEDLLRSAQRNERLPYDTSLFSGASGSPVFDLSGDIVAMHTQGYTLDVEAGKCSLMEFGVQFGAICSDLKRKNLLEELFPNYNLGNDEERMDTSSDAI